MSSSSSKGAWQKAPAINAAAAAAAASAPAAAAGHESTGDSLIAGLAAAVNTNSAASALSSSSSTSSSFSHVFIPGNLVALTLPNGRSVSGVVFVFDAPSNTVAIQLGDGDGRDYSIVNTAYVSDARLLKSAHVAAQKFPPIDTAKIAEREQRAIEDRKAEALKLGHNVSAEAQRLFDILVKIYACRWDGAAIVVMDAVRIEPPYTPAAATGSNAKQVERIRKMLEAERAKIGLKN